MRRDQALTELHNYAEALLADEGSATTVRAEKYRETLRVRRWRSPQIALASLGFMVFGNIGMAAAADSAVPGDLLYPVDRMYESVAGLVGIDSGGTSERLEEASVLLARGEFDVAVQTIAVAVSEHDSELGSLIEEVCIGLERSNAHGRNREDVHRAVAALASTVRSMTDPDAGNHGPSEPRENQTVNQPAATSTSTQSNDKSQLPGLIQAYHWNRQLGSPPNSTPPSTGNA